MSKPLLSIVTSHPIQYQAPLFRRLAQSETLSLRVEFLSTHGLAETYDKNFGASIRFDVPLVEGFEHSFHRNYARSKVPSEFLGQLHPGLIRRSAIKSDVVLLHGYGQASMWFAAIGRRRGGVPFMMRGESRLDSEQVMPAPKLRFKRETVGRIVRGASVCLPIGTPNRDFYLDYGVPQSRLVDAPYSVDNDYFAGRRADVQAERESRLRAFGLDPSLPTVIFAAKFAPWKRPGDLLRARERTSASFNLLMVGSGEVWNQLKSQSAEMKNTSLPGLMNQSALRDAFCLADVSVLPSEHEPWGLVVNESMAAGCLPVVSDAVGSGADLVAETTGCIYPTGNIEQLAHQLDRALMMVGDPLQAEKVRRAVDRFSIERTALGIEEATMLALSG